MKTLREFKIIKKLENEFHDLYLAQEISTSAYFYLKKCCKRPVVFGIELKYPDTALSAIIEAFIGELYRYFNSDIQPKTE